MDFLEKIYLDNTIGKWLTIAGVILLALLLKKYVSRYLASLLYRMVYKTWKSVDKKSFVDLLLSQQSSNQTMIYNKFSCYMLFWMCCLFIFYFIQSVFPPPHSRQGLRMQLRYDFLKFLHVLSQIYIDDFCLPFRLLFLFW